MARGHNPEWANLPKRHCDDCGKLYKPIQPLKEGQRGFCSATCRKSYHKHGGAYRKLRVEVQKMIAREFAALEKRLREMATAEAEAIVPRLIVYDCESRTCEVILRPTAEDAAAASKLWQDIAAKSQPRTRSA